ncbi:MAG: tail fiber protein, partial [Gammaproteobacteria bacterium]|nr:tail fiber protein [Gammaproteobacteria bacterium]
MWPGATADGDPDRGSPSGASIDTNGGDHDHDVTFEYVPDYQGLRLIKATGGKIEVPGDGVLLSNSNSTPAGMSSVYTDEKLLRGTDVIVTMNPDDKHENITLSNGNLSVTNSGINHAVRATLSRNSGKWYYECTIDFNQIQTQFTAIGFGEGDAMPGLGQSLINTAKCWGFNAGYMNPTLICGEGDTPDTRATGSGRLVVDDVVMMAVDFDAGKIWWGVNGSWFFSGDPGSGANATFTTIKTDGTPLFPMMELRGAGAGTVNFGAEGFDYAVPSGFTGWGNVGDTVGVTDVAFDSQFWRHIHWTVPYDGHIGEGDESTLVTTQRHTATGDPNDWPDQHDHGSFDDETIAQNLERAYLRAYTKATAYTGFTGSIIMFEGAVAPTGWVLCDGNNGTEDLRDCFIVLSNDATTAQTGDNTIVPAMETAEDGMHNHIYGYGDKDYVT